jgi:ABC-2 type transport system permease protein
VIYLISGFRWSFFGAADVNVAISAGITLAIFVICLSIIVWVFKTGYRLKT